MQSAIEKYMRLLLSVNGPLRDSLDRTHNVARSLYLLSEIRIAFSKNATTSINNKKPGQGKAKINQIDKTMIREAVRPMRNPLRNVKSSNMVFTCSLQKCCGSLCPGS